MGYMRYAASSRGNGAIDLFCSRRVLTAGHPFFAKRFYWAFAGVECKACVIGLNCVCMIDCFLRTLLATGLTRVERLQT